ncbi:energy transducer TonB [Parasulfitobacter algicola]|uniref:TonB family protein n=1 Tax=Parasulfitobacter algicola TaxID=2614809 RepID=A0ABX2IR03_9RHOB|nr:TonB family protein [Sulfitobacter algicola]NSX54785.1 TonB family protein [Sulfitobacter algicola]
MRFLHISLFAGIAFAVHLIPFLIWDHTRGADTSGGTDGQARVTIIGASGAITDMVRDWETAPEVQRDVQVSEQPLPITMPAPDVQLTAPKLPNMTVSRLAEPEMPDIDTTSAEKPVRSAPQSSVRPQSRPASPNSTAMGRGDQSVTGTGSQLSSAFSDAQRTIAKQEWAARIQRKLHQSMTPPRQSRSAQGTIVIDLDITPNGVLRSARLVQGSGNAQLDASVLQALRRIGPLPTAPNMLTQPSYPFRIPIRFKR